MQRVRTKICGITCVDDALAAVAAGADAIGLVFYGPSPRNVSVKTAQGICSAIPPFVTVVGLFVDAPPEKVGEVCRSVPLHLLQFHGDETEVECSGHHLPYIKAIKVRSDQDVMMAERQYQSAKAILVDTYKKGVAGGTGEVFDWSLVSARSQHSDKDIMPLILAGGLNPDNVRQAIETVRPFAVDVSGGVEREKGRKDPQKVIRFIEEVSRG